ncbi:metallophosphoesterase family protein [Microbacterium sp. USHLN186]|uniref:metallophosphoesterase family protein n=1 Tax=Microbacterium sp. USHLN186 TaxID=3081286 RepID=UPI003019CD13
MTTTLLLLADTHVPARARKLPDAVLRAVDEADIVVHAGDWVDVETLDLIESRSRSFHGVHGNNDGPQLRDRLPEVARFQVEDLRFAVIHETGPAARREERMDRAFPDTDVLVFGHSHIPWDTVTPAGMRLLNPGSPTDRRRQPVCTMMTVRVENRELHVDLIPVERTLTVG